MTDTEIEALEAQYKKAVYPSHVPGGNNVVFDSNLIEYGVRKLLDEVKRLRAHKCVHEQVREFFGACKAHKLTDCRTCSEVLGNEPCTMNCLNRWPEMGHHPDCPSRKCKKHGLTVCDECAARMKAKK